MAIYNGAFYGNPYVGLYARASDKLAILPASAHAKLRQGAQCLEVPLASVSVDGSPYLGLYVALNSNGAVMPSFAADDEAEAIRKHGLEVLMLNDGKFCACGNNIACNDFGAVANPDMPDEDVKKIAKALGVPVHRMAIAGTKTAGMAVACTNKGFVAHNRISEGEMANLEEIFKVKGMNGSVNSGTALPGLGVVANSHGAIVGERTSGFELSRVQQGLDLV
jgi:translation initiation factor 6